MKSVLNWTFMEIYRGIIEQKQSFDIWRSSNDGNVQWHLKIKNTFGLLKRWPNFESKLDQILKIAHEKMEMMWQAP